MRAKILLLKKEKERKNEREGNKRAKEIKQITTFYCKWVSKQTMSIRSAFSLETFKTGFTALRSLLHYAMKFTQNLGYVRPTGSRDQCLHVSKEKIRKKTDLPILRDDSTQIFHWKKKNSK